LLKARSAVSGEYCKTKKGRLGGRGLIRREATVSAAGGLVEHAGKHTAGGRSCKWCAQGQCWTHGTTGGGGGVKQDMMKKGGGIPSQEQAQMQQEQRAAMEEQKSAILNQILTPEARERLTRIGLVKKDKQMMLEQHLIQQATQGRLAGKVSEETLIQMLEGMNSESSSKKKITISRKKYFDEDDDDNDDDLL